MTEIQKQSFRVLSGNTLKIIALITMTIDHIGVQIFTENILLRIIGRISFPIFAFMIAEGCRYTKNRTKYLLRISVLAAICQLAYLFAMSSLYQCILVTFALSVCLIFIYDFAARKKSVVWGFAFAFALLAVYLVCEVLPKILINTDFYVDYGFYGATLPLLIYIGKDKYQKLILCAVGLVLLSMSTGGIQWYCLLALLPLILYSGERGRARIKNLFYIYYPVHLLLIYLVSIIIF